MENFIESEVLDGLRKGSMESFTEGLEAAASERLGEDVSLFATHPDHAFGVAGDRVVKVTWKRTKDGTQVQVEDAEVPVITRETLDTFVASKLSETVDKILEGDTEASRTQLRAIIRHVSEDGRYWVADGIQMAESVMAEKPQWLAVYEDSDGRAEIRKAVHGVLGETEKKVPKTPFSRIPHSRLPDFVEEIRESLGVMGDLLEGLPGQLKDLEFAEEEAHDVELAKARDSIVSESTSLKAATDVVLRFLREEDLPKAAKYHDILAERLRPMLVVGQLLSRQSDSQQSGENQNAPSP